jgi:hypothetical protein
MYGRPQQKEIQVSKYSTLNYDYYTDSKQTRLVGKKDDSIKIGIIRATYVDVSGRTKYTVEVHTEGRTHGMECVMMTRFGGIYNFEEYNIRPWIKTSTAAAAVGPKGAGEYSYRAGDTVIVTALYGTSREGVILGGIDHPGRTPKLQEEGIAYLSSFQGLETSITEEGNYKVTYNGKPINSAALEVPPTGASIPEPEYDPTISGSYFEFDEKGSYTIADDKGQIIKMKKQTGNIVIVSNDRRFEIGDADGDGLGQEGISMLSDNINMTAEAEMNVYAETSMNVTSEKMSLNAKQVAIGNSDWELFDQISQFLDILAEVTLIDSQGGPTLAFMASPQWAKIQEWKTKMETGIKGEITEVEPLSASAI